MSVRPLPNPGSGDLHECFQLNKNITFHQSDNSLVKQSSDIRDDFSPPLKVASHGSGNALYKERKKFGRT